MRKNKEGKKGHETIIGKIIYGVLLFAPLLSILATTMYAIVNENAYESYSDKYIKNTYKISSSNASLLEEGREYIFNGCKRPLGSSGTGWNISYTFTFENESLNLRQEFNTNYDINGIGYATDGNYTNYFRLYFHDKVNNTWIENDLYYFSNNPKILTLNFRFTLLTYDSNFYVGSNINYVINDYGSLDKAFEYGIKKVEENNLYNWSKTTGMYQAVKTTAEGLGITNTFTPMLLTYWFMISIIYFIYDIGLMLIMIVHRKIHELQESV